MRYLPPKQGLPLRRYIIPLLCRVIFPCAAKYRIPVPAYHPPQAVTVYRNGYNAQCPPKHAVKQTNLPFYIEEHIAIVPYVHFQAKVEKTPAYKFNRRYRKRAQGAANKQPLFSDCVDTPDKVKTYPAHDKHGPMGISPPQNL